MGTLFEYLIQDINDYVDIHINIFKMITYDLKYDSITQKNIYLIIKVSEIRSSNRDIFNNIAIGDGYRNILTKIIDNVIRDCKYLNKDSEFLIRLEKSSDESRGWISVETISPEDDFETVDELLKMIHNTSSLSNNVHNYTVRDNEEMSREDFIDLLNNFKIKYKIK